MSRLGIIGAGLMGGGIALNAARHGLTVDVYDVRGDAGYALRDRTSRVYNRWVQNGRMTQSEAEAALDRLHPVSSLAALGDSDIVIEAVFEDLNVKRELLTALAPHLTARSIVATNTSALKVADLAKGFRFTDRFLGLHYFSPAEVCPLVEVVRSDRTDEATVASALDFLAGTRRIPLHSADTPGFAINRFFCPYYNEATRLVEDGVGEPQDVDLVARERLGAAAGPFAVMNLIRPSVAAHAMNNLAQMGPFYMPSKTLRDRAGTDANWPVDATPQSSSAQLDLIEERLLGALALPALEIVRDKVADSVAVDHGATLALKFKEGPFALMRRYPPDVIERVVHALCTRHGHPPPHAAIPSIR